MIRSQRLFHGGFGWSSMNGPNLEMVLIAHERKMVDTIRSVVDIEALTDKFVTDLVNQSLVATVKLLPMTKKVRSERIDASQFPPHFSVMGENSYVEQVARLSIPFTGDRAILEHHPNQGFMNVPMGEINGDKIEWDVVLFKYNDDGKQVAQEIKNNQSMIETLLKNGNKQVDDFNKRLPTVLKDAFSKKLEELTRQLAIFEELGIPDTEEEKTQQVSIIERSPVKRAKARAAVILQIVENQYVQQYTQINKNDGDVNNAVQSN